MALLIANKDGTSNAKAGDTVVTGGGIYRKNADGTSTLISKLPTSTGKTSDYGVLTHIYNSMTSKPVKEPSIIDQTLNNTEVFDSATNYDSFTTPTGSGAITSGQTINFSNLFGYIIVGLVLLVILDKLMGGGK